MEKARVKRGPFGNSVILAVAWSVALVLIGYLWPKAVYTRNSVAYNLNSAL